MSKFVKLENTPNPLTKKLLVDQALTKIPYEVNLPYLITPDLARIFAAGVTSIFVGTNYLSLTVEDASTWTAIEPRVTKAVGVGDPDVISFASNPDEIEKSDDPVVMTIKELLDTKIRPAVAHDGGDVSFHSFKNGVLKLEMAGACSGCPSSTATLKYGILNLMRYYVPEVTDVEAA